MKQDRSKVSVCIVEPQSGRLADLHSQCLKLWDKSEVLPRTSAREFSFASSLLKCDLVLIRLSFLQANPSAQDALMEQLGLGAEVVLIQEGRHSFKPEGWTSLGPTHFISEENSLESLLALMVNIRLRQIGKVVADQ